MRLVLVGLNHHTAPIEVRERLSCAEHRLPDFLAALSARAEVREAIVLSTCNRMEVYAVVAAGDVNSAHVLLRRSLSAFHEVPEEAFASHLYCTEEQGVSAHLLRVASGLDSLVVGEPQILGQVRDALATAQQTGTVGQTLTALFQQAISGGRRARHETGLGRGAFSIGHAAVDLAKSIFADLSHASVLILGAGKMSELTAKHLVAHGVRFVVVANRTFEKAALMAERLGGRAIQYDAFPDALIAADIVISSTAAPHPILHRQTLAPILRKRRGKPLFLIDIAVPRDVDPDVNGLDNVFLYNIDDLQAVVAEEAQGRKDEAARAERIAAEEAAKFDAWHRAREAAPVIMQMRARMEQIQQAELTLLRSQLGHLSEREWQRIEAAMRALTNKVTREPILRLKRETEAQATEPDAIARYDLLSAAREIFNLPAEETDALETAVTGVGEGGLAEADTVGMPRVDSSPSALESGEKAEAHP